MTVAANSPACGARTAVMATNCPCTSRKTQSKRRGVSTAPAAPAANDREEVMNAAFNNGRPQADHVREVVHSAEVELRDLLHQRAEVMRRIGTIKQTLT